MEDGQGHIGRIDRIRAVVEEVLEGTDLFLVACELRGRTGSQVLDVFVDGDGGVDVDALAAANREIGFLLETEDLVGGRYHLNVSSPGVDRPLVLPRQYPKNVGRMLRVTYRLPVEAAGASAEGDAPSARTETVVGELRDADEAGIELAVSGRAPLRLPFEAVREARVQLPW